MPMPTATHRPSALAFDQDAREFFARDQEIVRPLDGAAAAARPGRARRPRHERRARPRTTIPANARGRRVGQQQARIEIALLDTQERPRRPRPAVWPSAVTQSGPRSPSRAKVSACVLVEASVVGDQPDACRDALGSSCIRTATSPRPRRRDQRRRDRRRTSRLKRPPTPSTSLQLVGTGSKRRPARRNT